MRSIEDADDEDDIFDENGLLRDGKRWRVPLRMMDSLQREVGGHFDTRPKSSLSDGVLHRPGFATDGRSVADRYRIYDQYDAEISAAYKNPPTGAGSRGTRGRQEGDLCTCRGPEFPDDTAAPAACRTKTVGWSAYPSAEASAGTGRPALNRRPTANTTRALRICGAGLVDEPRSGKAHCSFS